MRNSVSVHINIALFMKHLALLIFSNHHHFPIPHFKRNPEFALAMLIKGAMNVFMNIDDLEFSLFS